MARWERDCPEPGVVEIGNTLVLGRLAGAEHGQRALAGTVSS